MTTASVCRGQGRKIGHSAVLTYADDPSATVARVTAESPPRIGNQRVWSYTLASINGLASMWELILSFGSPLAAIYEGELFSPRAGNSPWY